jgi:hypothetical protein
MAEAAVLDRETPPEFPPEESTKPAKDKGGRPTNEKLEKDREKDPRGFAELVNSLTEADWEKHIIYLWRMDPWYDNTNGGRDVKYIGVYSQPVTEESLKQEYGSGSYRVQLNKGDKPVAHVKYTIMDEKYPPALPPGDWLDHPRNKKWTPFRALITARWNSKVAEQTKAAPAGSSSDASVDALTKLIAKLIEDRTGKAPASGEADKLTGVLVTWALNQTGEQRKAEREADSPDKLTALIKSIRELFPQPAPVEKGGIDPVLQLVLNGLRDDLKAARDEAKQERDRSAKLLERILDSKDEKTNPLAQLETFGNIIQRFGEITGKVGGVPRDWKDVLADTVGEVLPKAVELGQVYITQRQITDRARAAQAPRVTQPGAASAPPPPASATAPPAPPPPLPSPAPATNPAVNAAPDPAPAMEMDVNERTMIVYVAQLAAQAMNLAIKGDHFAEQICVKHGDQAYEDFVSGIPKETLIEKVKAIPEAWELLAAHEARLPQFIEDFYSFSQEADDEPEPEPAKPAKAAKAAPVKGKKK